MIKNKIEKPFGPSGSWTGIFLFIAGILISYYYSYFGLIFIVTGALIGFTSVNTLIDPKKRRVKSVTYIFGIIPFGKWIEIENGMKLGLKKIHRGYGTSTRGHGLKVHIYAIRIVLYSSNDKQIMSVQNTNSPDNAKKEMEQLSNQLGLSII